MDSNSRVIPIHLHPMGFIEGFEHFGAPLELLLRNTGISQQMLNNPIARISYNQQVQLLHNGVSLCRTPGLGLLLGMRWNVCFHGTVGYIVHCSPSMRDAAEAFRRYQMIAQPFYKVSSGKPLGYIDEDDRYIYPLRCFPSPSSDAELLQFEIEFRLATTLRLWDECGNKGVADPSVYVQLAYPEPPHGALYRQLPCDSVTFNAPQSHVSAHKAFRSEPFRPHRRAMFQKLLAQCEEELRQAGLPTSVSEEVRAHITSHLNQQLQWVGSPYAGYKPISLEDTAQALRLTPRTLARRLAAENTSFRRILHQARLDVTLYHLESSNLNVEDIAELTGFSCASSMRRAIKSAVGKPVSMTRPTRPA